MEGECRYSGDRFGDPIARLDSWGSVADCVRVQQLGARGAIQDIIAGALLFRESRPSLLSFFKL